MRSRLLPAIFVIALLAYAPSFTASFQYDDFDQVVYNPALEEPNARLLLAWARSRIIPFATLALNRWAGGEGALGFHVINFAVHLLAVWLVFGLAKALCRAPRMRDSEAARHGLAVAAATAAVFACHPIQVQGVTYIVQRMTSLAAMFYVGAVYFYTTGRNAAGEGGGQLRSRRAFLLAAAMALGAFLSKENSATLPITVLLAEWTFFLPAGRGRMLVRSLPFVFLLLVMPALWMAMPSQLPRLMGAAANSEREVPAMIDNLVRVTDPGGELSPLGYFLTQATVIPRYLQLILWPSGLNIDHDVPLAGGLSPAVVGGLVLLAVLAGIGVWALRRRPLVGFGILWLFVTLSVESSFLPIADVMVEHRLYLPMVGVALVAADAFVELRRRWPKPALAAGLVLLAALAGLTFARNLVWRTQLSLWSDALAKSPGKARVIANVGTALHLEGKLDAALPYYCRALEKEPDNERAQYHLNMIVEKMIEEGTAPVEMETGPDGEPVMVVGNPCEK